MHPMAVDTAEERVTAAPLTGAQRMAVARATRAFGSYGDVQKSMAKIAKAIVSLRITFEKDGRPDYRGETPQYRGAIAALYEATIEDPKERASFKVAIRYWVAKEFAARVAAGKIDAKDLEAAGIGTTDDDDAPPAREREPRREDVKHVPTGVTMGERELSPHEVVAEAERILAEHVVDEHLGIVLSLQHVSRELAPIVEGLRRDEVRDRQPGRALQAASQQLLNLALDAAALGGVEIERQVAGWIAETAVSA